MDLEKNINNSDANPFRYCGEYFDSETGTIYLRARYYNPTTGRSISRDSFAGRKSDPLSLNLYTYCHNNPILYFDPSGHNIFEDCVDACANWCENRIDDTKEFVSDALTTGKEFVKGQCERGSEFWNNPSLISGLDWFSGGYVSACNQRYQEADDLYGYANWALSGIPDMVKGAFAPEKPDHFSISWIHWVWLLSLPQFVLHVHVGKFRFLKIILITFLQQKYIDL